MNRYTHEGKLIGLHEFSCRDTGKTRTVKLRRTPKFWCDESGRMYDGKNGWPRFRRLWRLDLESVRRINQDDKMLEDAASEIEKSRELRLRLEQEYK